jgi:divalent metal cation (Fe/Co/Zn/Cd) transporter
MKLSALYSAEMSSLPTPISPQRASSVSVMTNACLVIIKLIAGFTTGSIALITDGLHSFIDLIAAAIALISIRVAARPADATHEYGHGKLENLSALIEGVLILVGAAVIVEQGIVRLLHPHPLHDIGFGLVVAAIAVSVVSALVRFFTPCRRPLGITGFSWRCGTYDRRCGQFIGGAAGLDSCQSYRLCSR